jgi:hypothetical protein
VLLPWLLVQAAVVLGVACLSQPVTVQEVLAALFLFQVELVRDHPVVLYISCLLMPASQVDPLQLQLELQRQGPPDQFPCFLVTVPAVRQVISISRPDLGTPEPEETLC